MKKNTKHTVDHQRSSQEKKGRIPWLFGWEVKDLVHPIIIRRAWLFQFGILLLALATIGYFVWDNYLRQPNGVEIVQKMVDAAGGMEGWNNVRQGTFTRTQHLYNESGEELSKKIQTFFFRKTEDGLKLLIKSITNEGEEVWVGEDKGGYWATKSELPSDPKKTARDLGMMCDSKFCAPSCASSMAFYRFSMPFKLTDYGVLPDLAGTVSLDDKEAQVLEVNFIPTVGKDRWVFYVYPEDHLIRKIEYHNQSDKGHSRPEDMYWSDYRDEGGIIFSHKWSRYWGNGQIMEEYIFSDVDFETELAENFFDRPEGYDELLSEK